MPELIIAKCSVLGACTSITLRMYAKRKGWEIGSVSVSLPGLRIHTTLQA